VLGVVCTILPLPDICIRILYIHTCPFETLFPFLPSPRTGALSPHRYPCPTKAISSSSLQIPCFFITLPPSPPLPLPPSPPSKSHLPLPLARTVPNSRGFRQRTQQRYRPWIWAYPPCFLTRTLGKAPALTPGSTRLRRSVRLGAAV